jgi:alpha,alpha-trehalase
MRKSIACLLWLSSGLLVAAAAASELATPAELYGELFERVQLSDVYQDSKTFADALPNRPPEQLLAEYRLLRAREDFDLGAFIAERFTTRASRCRPTEA